MEQPRLTARARAEEVARASYGRLLAVLAAPTGDIPTAEDALSDAFVQAIRRWPIDGVPGNPEGWLVTVARNRLRDRYKSSAFRATAPLETEPTVWSAVDQLDIDAIPDKRLELMFVCAHPAIDQAARAPLMLQTVLGFDASQIAAAFSLPAPTMAQRLVRAKRRIRDARIPFSVPSVRDMPARLLAVLEAIYGAYAIDWLVAGTTARESLAEESLYLAVTLASLLPTEPEALGLAALISLSMSRAHARLSPEGSFVPLDEQHAALWDTALIAQGESLLARAHTFHRIGRFQVEAAIQSVHCARAVSGITDLLALRTLYEALTRIAPTLGALVSLAATIGEIDGPEAGLAYLDGLDQAALRRFQPAWATRAHLLAELGRPTEAAAAYAKAISLTTDPAARTLLGDRLAEL